MGNVLYLERASFQAFLSNINQLKLRKMNHTQVKLMFETMLYGAMRISEVLQITPESLVGNDQIKLEVTKGGVERCKCSKWSYRPAKLVSSDKDCIKCHGNGKYRIPAYAYVLPEVYADLQEIAKTKKPNEKLFPVHRTIVWKYVDKLFEGRTHTFRHTWLTWMLEKEKFNIRDIKQKARHKSLLTTTNYIEANQDVTRKKEAEVFERI